MNNYIQIQLVIYPTKFISCGLILSPRWDLNETLRIGVARQRTQTDERAAVSFSTLLRATETLFFWLDVYYLYTAWKMWKKNSVEDILGYILV